MQTAHGNLHLEIQTSRKSPVGILRTSFRENGKMKHTQHGRITGCSLEQLKILQLAFRERVVPVDDPQAFKILSSREYGASYAILAIAKQLGLHQALYSRPELWVNSALAMIVGRLVWGRRAIRAERPVCWPNKINYLRIKKRCFSNIIR